MSDIHQITPLQYGAIRRSHEAGARLQKDIPQIAEDYRSGTTVEEIIAKYDLKTRYSLTDRVAHGAVYCALAGSNLPEAPYHGLIPEEERRTLSKIHTRRGLDRYIETHFEEFLAIRKASGYRSHELGLGVHARNKEQMRRDGLEGALVSGSIPWKEEINIGEISIPSEIKAAMELSRHPDYLHGRRIDMGRIAETLNEIYHDGKEVRNANSVAVALSKIRKKKGEAREAAILWGEEESVTCIKLAEDPQYQSSRGIRAKNIAAYLNEHYHQRAASRTAHSVKSHLRRYHQSSPE